jgi:hypothetical protein
LRSVAFATILAVPTHFVKLFPSFTGKKYRIMRGKLPLTIWVFAAVLVPHHGARPIRCPVGNFSLSFSLAPQAQCLPLWGRCQKTKIFDGRGAP